ncbi:retromer subunit [Saccharomycopsis crataegensis]|uniref:Vacuolar protein sorting-associated protein 29 n=1 Tax=Saccharomycopsis crataegensis TaxID=43959 RepID=A0AAV5QPC5_9ASCO|nr:retromer subunit [Saccharomycopsis crataegensis]
MLLLAIGDIFIPERAIDFPNEFKKLLLPGKIQQVLCLGNVTSSLETMKFLDSLSPDLQIVKGAHDFDSKLPLSSVVQHDQLRIGFLSGFSVVPKNDPLSLLVEARKMDVDILIWGGTHRVEAYTLDNKLFINPGSATGAPVTEDLSDEDDAEGEEEEEEEEETEAEAGAEANNVSEQEASHTDGSNNNGDKAEKGVEKYAKDIEESRAQVERLLDLADDEMSDPVPSFCLLDVQGAVCTLYIYTYLDDEVKVDKVTYRKE